MHRQLLLLLSSFFMYESMRFSECELLKTLFLFSFLPPPICPPLEPTRSSREFLSKNIFLPGIFFLFWGKTSFQIIFAAAVIDTVQFISRKTRRRRREKIELNKNKQKHENSAKFSPSQIAVLGGIVTRQKGLKTKNLSRVIFLPVYSRKTARGKSTQRN